MPVPFCCVFRSCGVYLFCYDCFRRFSGRVCFIFYFVVLFCLMLLWSSPLATFVFVFSCFVGHVQFLVVVNLLFLFTTANAVVVTLLVVVFCLIFFSSMYTFVCTYFITISLLLCWFVYILPRCCFFFFLVFESFSSHTNDGRL